MTNEPISIERVAALIRAGLPDATVQVQSEDNVHFAARVVSAQFAGKRPIARHQLIYKALGALVGREIHALSIEALTPAESGLKSSIQQTTERSDSNPISGDN